MMTLSGSLGTKSCACLLKINRGCFLGSHPAWKQELMVVYDKEGKEEMFDYHRCDVEVLKNEPTDGLTDGLKMPF